MARQNRNKAQDARYDKKQKKQKFQGDYNYPSTKPVKELL